MPDENIFSLDGDRAATLHAAERDAQRVMAYWHERGYMHVSAWPVVRGRNREDRPIWGCASNLVAGMPAGKPKGGTG